MSRLTSRGSLLRSAGSVLTLLALFAVLASYGSAGTRGVRAPGGKLHVNGLRHVTASATDDFWMWPGAVVLHVGTSPAGDSPGWVRSDPYYIDCPNACDRPYDVGQTVVLTAHPTRGFTFTAWDGDACAGQGNPCTLTMKADTTVTAVFTGHFIPETPPPAAPGTATLNVSIFGGFLDSSISSSDGKISCGFLSSSCSAVYPVGSSVTLTAGAFISTFLNWTDGASTVGSNPYTFTMTGNRTVQGNFNFGCFFC